MKWTQKAYRSERKNIELSILYIGNMIVYIEKSQVNYKKNLLEIRSEFSKFARYLYKTLMAVLFIIAPTRKFSKCPSRVNGSTNCGPFIQWDSPQDQKGRNRGGTQCGWYFLLNERSQSQRVIYYMISSVWHSQKDQIIELEKGQPLPGGRGAAVWQQREKNPERIWGALVEFLCILTVVIITWIYLCVNIHKHVHENKCWFCCAVIYKINIKIFIQKRKTVLPSWQLRSEVQVGDRRATNELEQNGDWIYEAC